MDLDIDISNMDEDDRKGLELNKNRIVKAIVNGSMVVNDDGEPVFTPTNSKDPNPLTFHEPSGASLMAMDKKKKSEDMGKMYAIMGNVTKTNAQVFSSMNNRDLKVCMAVITLFLA